MTQVHQACAELAVLCPQLRPALTRDNTGTKGTTLTAGSVVNTDVLHAIITISQQIPDTTTSASARLGETWARRGVATCLRALPRLHDRLSAVGFTSDAAGLETSARYWTRTVKQALGLRTADIPIGYRCPYHADPATSLVAAGSEGFLRRQGDGLVVEWEHAARIWCPHCGESWGASQWLLLGQMLGAEQAVA